MEQGDAEQVAELTRELGYDMSVVQTRDRIANQSDGGVVLVAVSAGEVVGWIQGLNRELLIYPRVLEVGGLVVSAPHRARGIGRALIGALTEWGRGRGHIEIFVRSNIMRDGAHAFYEGLGFIRAKTSYTFSFEIE